MSLVTNKFTEPTISVQEINGSYHWSSPPRAMDVIELARAILRQQLSRGKVLYSPKVAVDFFQMQFGDLLHEELWVVFLDNRRRVISVEKLFRGTINRSEVYPREIVRQALLLGTSSIMLAHNHPSGDVEPSVADCRVTRIVKAALELVEIELADHFIIAQNSYTSFRETGLLN